jgi:hypothetical protein
LTYSCTCVGGEYLGCGIFGLSSESDFLKIF